MLVRKEQKYILPEIAGGEPIVTPKSPLRKGEVENLKQRAYLNSLTSMIDYSVLQIVGFVVSPFIVKGLGNAMYGVWKMLSQMTGYATLADSRATQVLKWTVAKKKDVVTEEELRSDVSSALFVTLLILPLVLLTGAVISWYAPVITQAAPQYHTLVRLTCSLLILSAAISRVFDLFEAVLRGMNLGFKRMGFRAAIVLGGGGLKVYALTHGYGLIGLSIIQVLITLVTGFTFYTIVKKSVGWFGFGKTNLHKIKAFGKLSGWNMANTTADTLLTGSDKVILGYFASPLLVTSYALTQFLPLAIQGLIVRVIIGVMPGIGKLLGLKDYEKIRRVRGTINDMILLLMTAAGVTIILFNHSFLKSWVGKSHYAGHWVNALIIITVLQDIYIKHDGHFITATLDLKRKVYLTVIAVAVYAGLASLLINYLGIAGLCMSILAGKFILFTGQRRFIRTKVQQEGSSAPGSYQPILVSLLMLVGAGFVATLFKPLPFMHLLWLAPITFLGTLFLFYLTGIGAEGKAEIVRSISSVKWFKSS